MIDDACGHSWSCRSKHAVFSSTQRTMRANKIIHGNADSEFGFEPLYRASEFYRFAHKVGIPQTPVQVRPLNIRGINGMTGGIFQSFLDTGLTSIDHITLHFDHAALFARLVHYGIFQVGVDDLYRFAGSSPLAGRLERRQFMVKFTQNRFVM
jgi:hypothetical protein